MAIADRLRRRFFSQAEGGWVRESLLQLHLCHSSRSHTANHPRHIITSAPGRTAGWLAGCLLVNKVIRKVLNRF